MAALLIAMAGRIYEQFSHGVYSDFMLYAFLFPLAGGALPYLLLFLYPLKQPLTQQELRLHSASIATFTVGSVITGILDIYGTTNHLTGLYWLAGGSLLAAAVGKYLQRLWASRKR